LKSDRVVKYGEQNSVATRKYCKELTKERKKLRGENYYEVP